MLRLALMLLFTSVASGMGGDLTEQPGLVLREFIYESAPFPECHASTVIETPGGLLAAWFGGTREKHPDVEIWMARWKEGKWSAPVSIATGIQEGGMRFPCWNPVLFRGKGGPLRLFYKVGPDPEAWWGMESVSTDDGGSWSEGVRLPNGILGPIKNKPIQLPTGTWVSPVSTEDRGWRIHFELSTDAGKSWTATAPIPEKEPPGLIQPTILRHEDGRLQALCRDRKAQHIYEVWSSDEGRTWSAPAPTSLPNPNSGIDGVTLADGRQLLVYNHTPKGRSPLNVAMSRDGKTWSTILTLEDEPGEYSYPAVIQTNDGLVHATYTWKRKRLRHVVIDPAKLPKTVGE